MSPLNTKSSGQHLKQKNAGGSSHITWETRASKPEKAARRNQRKKFSQDIQPGVAPQVTTSGRGNNDSGWEDFKAALNDSQTSWANSRPTQIGPQPTWGKSKPRSGNVRPCGNSDESQLGPIINDWDLTQTSYPQKTPEEIAQDEKKAKLQTEHWEMIQKLWGWPWKNAPPQLVILAPYLPNYYHRDPFSLPKAEQSSKLFSLLNVDIIRNTILGWILRDHFDGANFAISCRTAFFLLAGQITFWDMTDGWFNNCEYPRYGPESSDKPSQQGSVQSVLLITPVRHFKQAITKGTRGNSRLYSRQITHLRTMLRSLYNFADFIDTVQFHRTGFLTVDLLNLIIPHMRNLKVLGVYNCQLIHIGHTFRLLDIIKEDRPLGKEDQVYLDFFPMYHLGPRSGAHRTGSYGVIWDNWGGDTRLAIWAIVTRILPRASAQGINLTKQGTAFYRWLEMSPCWNVGETLDAIKDTSMDPVKLATMLNWPHYQGNVTYFKRKLPFRPEGWEWAVKYYTCSDCHEDLLGILYHFTQIRSQYGSLGGSNSPIYCLGCSLINTLEGETDHFKYSKRKIVSKWIREDDPDPNDGTNGAWEFPELNSTDLARALEDFERRDVAKDVRELDRARYCLKRTGRHSDRFDREFEERQRPRTRAEEGRHGNLLMAPEVGMYQEWREHLTMSKEELRWWGFDTRRYCGYV